MTIRSAAQLAMFERCASDPEYAKERGISQDFAAARVRAYREAESPSLPDRAAVPPPRSQAATSLGLLGED